MSDTDQTELDLAAAEEAEGREALLVALTEATARTLDAPKETVRVIVEEVPKTHWGIGGTSAASLDCSPERRHQ